MYSTGFGWLGLVIFAVGLFGCDGPVVELDSRLLGRIEAVREVFA